MWVLHRLALLLFPHHATAKDHDLKQAVKDYESQLLQVTQSLAEYKSRALNAELQLEESSTNNSRVQELEKEVKEKSILVGKLRQEGMSLIGFACIFIQTPTSCDHERAPDGGIASAAKVVF